MDRPADIATLYSRARTEATRYGDFTASRRQVRSKFPARLVRDLEPQIVERHPAGQLHPASKIAGAAALRPAPRRSPMP